MPSGCCHGSIIYSPDGKIESQTGIGPEIVCAVTEYLQSINKSVFIYEHNSVNCVYLEEHPSLDFYAITRGYDPSIRDMRGTDYMDRVRAGQVVVTKMCQSFLLPSLVYGNSTDFTFLVLPMEVALVEEHMEKMNSRFKNGEDYRMTRALPDIIELIPATIDKSVALAYFSQKYNVEPVNILTFGDGENDVGMVSILTSL